LPEKPDWNEHIYIEGGPEWINDCTGRGDIGLMRPVDHVDLYPGGGAGCHRYVRTTRGWVSPIYGTVHTIFEHVGKVA